MTVVDNFGVASSPKTCGNCASTKIQASSFDFVILLISLSILLMVPFLIWAFEKFRKNYGFDRDWWRYEDDSVYAVAPFMYRPRYYPQRILYLTVVFRHRFFYLAM